MNSEEKLKKTAESIDPAAIGRRVLLKEKQHNEAMKKSNTPSGREQFQALVKGKK